MFAPLELDHSLLLQGLLPTTEQTSKGADALKLITTTLLGDTYQELPSASPISYSSTIQGVTLVLSPIGSYGLRCWNLSAVISCCIAGTPSDASFFTVALRKLRKAVNDGVIVLKADRSNSNMFEVDVLGIRFSLQYHQSQYATCWSKIGEIDGLSKMPYLARIKFNVYRDTVYLLSIIPNHEIFKLSYLVIKRWACQNGLMSSRFGYLDETQLIWMVVKICTLAQPTAQHSVASVVQEFFTFYSSLNYDSEIVSVSSDAPTKSAQRQSYGPGMAVLSYHSPTVNISNVKSKRAMSIIKSEFARTEAQLKSQNWNFDSLVNGSSVSDTCSGSLDDPRMRFFSSFQSYIKINVSYWGSSLTQGGEFFDWVDMMVSSYANELHTNIPLLSARAWPTRFINALDIDPLALGPRHTAMYLFGLKPSDTYALTHSRSLEEVFELTSSAVATQASQFLTRLESSSNYNVTTSWIGITQVSSVEAYHPGPDTKVWPLLPLGEKDDDLSSDEDCSADLPYKAKPGLSSVAKPKSAPPNPTSRPLRPALDILNRIRHDPNMDIADYIIGYLDRHSGIMEMPVNCWKGGDNTDEDFIPQSRVLYFRRKGDANGFRIWERERRIDRVFGSGNGNGDENQTVN